MRKECGKRGIKGVKVVFSEELPLEPFEVNDAPPEPQREGSSRRSLPGSTAFVPGAAGLLLAGEVVRDLIKETT
jgi:tRNA A37 threonylcarbamoyladenosine dehydratase